MASKQGMFKEFGGGLGWGGGGESVPKYKQIQGYIVPEKQKYSSVCLCLWIQFNVKLSIDLIRTEVWCCVNNIAYKNTKKKKRLKKFRIRGWRGLKKVKFPTFWYWRHLWAALWTCALKAWRSNIVSRGPKWPALWVANLLIPHPFSTPPSPPILASPTITEWAQITANWFIHPAKVAKSPGSILLSFAANNGKSLEILLWGRSRDPTALTTERRFYESGRGYLQKKTLNAFVSPERANNYEVTPVVDLSYSWCPIYNHVSTNGQATRQDYRPRGDTTPTGE